jgi:hypothetical protein
MLKKINNVPRILQIGINFTKKPSVKIISKILTTKNTIETKLRITTDRLADKYHLK